MLGRLIDVNQLITWIQGQGILGAFIFSILYAVFVVGLLPGAILTLAAGFLYGLWGGVAVVLPGAIVGAGISYHLSKRWGRSRVESKMENFPKFMAYSRAVSERGFFVGTLLRLSPVIPFGLLNYFLGVTKISPRDYWLSTSVGIIPGTFLYVYLGSTAAELSKVSETGGSEKMIISVVGLVVTLITVVLVTRSANRILKESENASSN